MPSEPSAMPRNTNTFFLTFATTSPQGWSSYASGKPRAKRSSSAWAVFIDVWPATRSSVPLVLGQRLLQDRPEADPAGGVPHHAVDARARLHPAPEVRDRDPGLVLRHPLHGSGHDHDRGVQRRPLDRTARAALALRAPPRRGLVAEAAEEPLRDARGRAAGIDREAHDGAARARARVEPVVELLDEDGGEDAVVPPRARRSGARRGLPGVRERSLDEERGHDRRTGRQLA